MPVPVSKNFQMQGMPRRLRHRRQHGSDGLQVPSTPAKGTTLILALKRNPQPHPRSRGNLAIYPQGIGRVQ